MPSASLYPSATNDVLMESRPDVTKIATDTSPRTSYFASLAVMLYGGLIALLGVVSLIFLLRLSIYAPIGIAGAVIASVLFIILGFGLMRHRNSARLACLAVSVIIFILAFLGTVNLFSNNSKQDTRLTIEQARIQLEITQVQNDPSYKVNEKAAAITQLNAQKSTATEAVNSHRTSPMIVIVMYVTAIVPAALLSFRPVKRLFA
jgi:hypothetical protein